MIITCSGRMRWRFAPNADSFPKVYVGEFAKGYVATGAQIMVLGALVALATEKA
jgi:hypothetical protein